MSSNEAGGLSEGHAPHPEIRTHPMYATDGQRYEGKLFQEIFS